MENESTWVVGRNKNIIRDGKRENGWEEIIQPGYSHEYINGSSCLCITPLLQNGPKFAYFVISLKHLAVLDNPLHIYLKHIHKYHCAQCFEYYVLDII